MPAADMAQVGLHAWWKEGDLLLGVPASKDRPARRPLVDLSPTMLPEEFLGWEPIGEACQEPPRSIAALNGQQVEGAIAGTPMHPVVQLVQNERIMAENALGRPAKVCEIRIVQADAMPGLELIVAWRTGEGEEQIRGFTVFRIPEALGTPAKPNND